MSETLRSLADLYDREAHGALSQRKRWALRDSASLFRRMVGNRAAADPTQLTINLSLLLDIPERWCRQHGYRAVAGHGGYVIQRDGEPAIVGGVGDTLRWDGERLTVSRSAE
ncbi:hypothetical protein [Streptomyces sp. NPDC093223]|uniref:hypothetical protein n=1 Tax=Streptomyces sp. NPDC093223 TaxID=3366033 RepID=UPI003825A8DF